MGLSTWVQEKWFDWRYGPEVEVPDDEQDDVFAQPTVQQRTIQRVHPDEYDEEDEEVDNDASTLIGEPVDEVDELLHEELHQSAGLHGHIVNGTIWCAGVFGTPVLWFILGLGNAELYSGFQGFSMQPLVVLAYVFGFAVEFFGIAMTLLSGKYASEKKWGSMWATLGLSVFVALSSFLAQYVLLQNEYSKHMLSFSDTVLQGLPINGHNGIFLLRALTPTVLGYAVVFLFAERNPSAIDTLRKKKKLQAELHEYRRGQAVMKQEDAINEIVVGVAEGLTSQLRSTMSQYLEHGMIIQQQQPLVIERHVTQHIPEQAQSKQFVQPNPNTLTQRTVSKPIEKQEPKPTVQQSVAKNVSLEGDEEEVRPQKPLLPPVQPQQVTPKPLPHPFAKTDVTQQQTSKLGDKEAELVAIRKLLGGKE